VPSPARRTVDAVTAFPSSSCTVDARERRRRPGRCDAVRSPFPASSADRGRRLAQEHHARTNGQKVFHRLSATRAPGRIPSSSTLSLKEPVSAAPRSVRAYPVREYRLLSARRVDQEFRSHVRTLASEGRFPFTPPRRIRPFRRGSSPACRGLEPPAGQDQPAARKASR